MRRLSVWLLVASIGVAGSEAAHTLAYRLVRPDRLERARVLQETGHGYFRYAPLAAAALGILFLIGLAARVSLARRRVPTLSVAAWAGLVPVVTFALQEHLERLFAGGSFPWGAALEPTFLPGLLLQLPLGLVAYLLVRLLLRGADRLGHALARPLRPLALRSSSASPPALDDVAPRVRVLALRQAGRAPPRLALAR